MTDFGFPMLTITVEDVLKVLMSVNSLEEAKELFANVLNHGVMIKKQVGENFEREYFQEIALEELGKLKKEDLN